MNTVLSPLTKSSNTTFERSIEVSQIVDAYKVYEIDVSSYFNAISKVSVYKCNDTNYSFYYPFNLSGNSSFYEHFQKFDWYYMPWKWEHEITKEYIKSGMKLLEVGCAHGHFIKKVNELYDLEYSVGLELNETTKDKDGKWEIINQTIQDYSQQNKNKFDIVCSYQVLEHITEVHGFIKGKIDCLKSGGTLIISVPNNDSFIKDGNGCLNMPPHHMGLWNEKSLIALTNIFPLKLIKVHFEELQDYHVSGYVFSEYYSKYSKVVGKIIQKFHKISGLYNKRIRETDLNKQYIKGHTILVTYQKI